MKRLIGAIALITTLAAGGVFAQPASAAPGAEFVGDSIIGCVVTVTVTVEDGGTYYLNVWDDGTFRDGWPFEAATGETVEVSFTVLWPILQGAAGLGVYVEDGRGTEAVNTFDSLGAYAGADDVGQACADSEGADSGAPPGAILNEVLAADCAVTMDVTATGLGDYTAVVLDGETVLVELDFVGTAGQRQDVVVQLPPPFEGELTAEIRDAETAEVYATDTFTADCALPPTTTTTAAPTTTTTARVADVVTVAPAFTG
jgi:hypothetical protein